ncbi:MAG: HD domain-containing phosphohydrolase [Candidatus Hydrogenedentota bacterium]
MGRKALQWRQCKDIIAGWRGRDIKEMFYSLYTLYLYRLSDNVKSELTNIFQKENITFKHIQKIKDISKDRFIIIFGGDGNFDEDKATLINKIKDNPVVILGDDKSSIWKEFKEVYCLPLDISPDVMCSYIKLIMEKLKYSITLERVDKGQKEQTEKLYKLQNIGISLISEKDINKLLYLILEKCREITNADAGTLYLIEESEDGKKVLKAKLTQNDSIKIESKEFVVPVSDKSISGYVALTGEPLNIADVYEMDETPGFSFNKEFDKITGYRSKSMITVPMKNKDNEILGVVQLINKRSEGYTTPIKNDLPEVEQWILPFTRDDQKILLSLTNQAAVVYENTLLYENIKKLFEGFIKASMTAIESRDPTTSGHSERVALYCVALAEAVNRTTTGKYKEVYFTDEQIRELRYAAILHDFGKIGVKEDILVKAKKLYPWQFELIKERFKFIKRTIELSNIKKIINNIIPSDKITYISEEINDIIKKEHDQLEVYLKIIEMANEPTVLPNENINIINDIKTKEYTDIDNSTKPYLTEDEATYLSIKKGSLSDKERKEIESHVVHTYEFLSKIPWTKDLKNVPEIAYGHHEKLTGKGYPTGKKGDELCLQSRIMAIADVFDALTARDRPYKKAIPAEKAVQIMENEVKAGNIDEDLFRIFIEASIHKLS